MGQAAPPGRAVFDTDAVEPAARFDAWRAAFGYGFQLDRDPAAEGVFHGRVEAAPVDDMVVSRMDAAAFSVARTSSHVRADGLEHFVLHLNAHSFAFEADGEDRGRTTPGAVTINDLSRTSRRSAVAETDSLILSLPRAAVESVLPDLDALHGALLAPAANAFMADHMRALAGLAFGIDGPAPAEGLQRATALILAACLRMDGRSLAAARPAVQPALLVRAKRHVDANLADGDLSPAGLAAALRISRGALYALFEPLGGVERHVRRRRLAFARRLLLEPGSTIRVSQAAYQAGFASPAHFSRAFREVYGVSPSEARAEPAAAAAPTEGQSSIASLVTALG